MEVNEVEGERVGVCKGVELGEAPAAVAESIGLSVEVQGNGEGGPLAPAAQVELAGGRGAEWSGS